MTVEKKGEYVTSTDANNAADVWLTMTDEQRSELLMLRSEQRKQNMLPAREVGSVTSADWPES